MDARVIGYNETTKYQSTTPSQKFTVYNVRVKYGGREWEISKRYNDFAKLHEELRIKRAEVANFKFPGKSVLNTKSKSTKEKRREGFDHYMVLLSRMNPLPTEVLDFTDVANHSKVKMGTSPDKKSPKKLNNSHLNKNDSSSLNLYPLIDNTKFTSFFGDIDEKVALVSNFPHLSSMIIITGSFTSIFAFLLKYFIFIHFQDISNDGDTSISQSVLLSPFLQLFIVTFVWIFSLYMVGAHQSHV